MSGAEGQKGKLGAIALARHGRPTVRRQGWTDWKGFNVWWDSYEKSGLDPKSIPTDSLREEAGNASVLIASPIPRAQETARAVCGTREVETSDLFLEAPLPAPPMPISLPMSAWWVVGRFYWWLGYLGDFECRKDVEARAELAADKVIAAAERGDVLVCAHGWFNRMVGRRLKRRGWRVVHNGGDAYWGWRKYLPPS